MNGRPPGRDDRRRPQGGLRINHRIRIPEVRVIIDEDAARGHAHPRGASAWPRRRARSRRDLAARVPAGVPDHGLRQVQVRAGQEEAAGPQAASTVEIKEIKFRPKTEGHDMDFKVKHVRRFLEEGNKVRLAVVFRGREITHPQTGKNVLDRVVEATADLSGVEIIPNLEGKRMIMIIAPKANVVRRAAEVRKQVLAAIQAKKDAAKAAGHAPPPEVEEEDEEAELDAINADVQEDDEE
jgi:translation initiation factor IF-3